MNKIVFVTNNAHKLEEIKAIMGERIEILSLKEINCFDDIPETANTLEGNALLKAQYIKEKYGYNCFADDTGLEIESLNNEPGVYSARYAGEENNAEKNIEKVLHKLGTETNRKARFRTVIALILENVEYTFDGEIKGQITTEKKGTTGFGYDPIFVPDGYQFSFAQLGSEIKNTISHRAKAVEKLVNFLRK